MRSYFTSSLGFCYSCCHRSVGARPLVLALRLCGVHGLCKVEHWGIRHLRCIVKLERSEMPSGRRRQRRPMHTPLSLSLSLSRSLRSWEAIFASLKETEKVLSCHSLTRPAIYSVNEWPFLSSFFLLPCPFISLMVAAAGLASLFANIARRRRVHFQCPPWPPQPRSAQGGREGGKPKWCLFRRG